MLASTMQISTHHPPTTPDRRHPRRQPTPGHARHQDNTPGPAPRNHRLFSQNPNRVPTAPPGRHTGAPFPTTPTTGGGRTSCADPRPAKLTSAPTQDTAPEQDPPETGLPGNRPLETGLPRKEVIQPHLPVRLPCYDFVPIASPTFDGSPPHGLGHRLRVLPTFVT
jgi:hypothetical protein